MLLILFFLLMLAILSLKISVNLKNIKISNIDENGEKTKLRKVYDIEFKFYIFNIIKIAKVEINNKKFRQVENKIKEEMKKTNVKDIFYAKKNLSTLKEIKLKVKKFNINLLIGTQNITTTVGLVTIISSIIPILLRNTIQSSNIDKFNYRVLPIYNNGNVINMEAESIIEIYFVHIIYVLYIIKMKGRSINDGRNKSESSNRRTYDYSNG